MGDMIGEDTGIRLERSEKQIPDRGVGVYLTR